MSDNENPLDPSEEHLQRIRERAYHLWESEGRPEGRAEEYWERARELDAIQSSPPPLRQPPKPGAVRSEPGGAMVEEASLQQNLGEFPDRLADEGEVMTTPTTRKEARAFRDGRR
jgi:hypothetical protein